MSSDFDGRVVIVTGAASGIGRSTAELFARRGARVVASDVDIEGGEETVKRIQQQGDKALFVACDISNSDQVQTLVQTTVDQFGRLDCACNNAGVEGQHATTVDCTEEIAEVIVWLASDAASFVTGQLLAADGGFVAQ